MSQQTNNQNLPRVEFQVHFRTGQHGRKHLIKGPQMRKPEHSHEDLPRLTRLLALAHRWNRLIEEGAVADYTEIARLMALSRARVTQIVNLLYLAPEIQEEILFSTRSENPELDLPERSIRPITRTPNWNDQLKMWRKMRGLLLGRKAESDW